MSEMPHDQHEKYVIASPEAWSNFGSVIGNHQILLQRHRGLGFK